MIEQKAYSSQSRPHRNSHRAQLAAAGSEGRSPRFKKGNAIIERILPLAEQIKDNWSLCEFFADMGNRAAEKEYLVAETIHACKINHAEHGECFSLKGKLQNLRQWPRGQHNGLRLAR